MRTLSSNSESNKDALVQWLQEQSAKWAEGIKPTPKDYSDGHMLVYTICSESTAPKDAEANCYILYLDYVRGCIEQFPEPAAQQQALKALRTVFKYLDQHYTDTKKRPGAKITKTPTSKLAPGQTLAQAADFIKADPVWTPEYVAPSSTAAGKKPVAAAYVTRTTSDIEPLQRTVSNRTTINLDTLTAWVQDKAATWAQGVKATPKDFSEGHMLVYTLCTEAGQPKNAERLCYEMFLNYIRGIEEQFPEGDQRAAAVKALVAIFRYLDQHWTNTKLRSTGTTKEPTSKLVPGQGLQAAAQAIFADPAWIPDYQAVGGVKPMAPGPAPVAEAPAPTASQELTRSLTSELPREKLAALKAYLFDNLELFASGEKVEASLLSEGYTLVYNLCTGPEGTDAEKAVYMVFLQTVRDAIRGFTGKERRLRHEATTKALVSVFRYLDRWYTVAADKLRRTKTKDRNTLAAGQTLKEASQRIYNDPAWMPEFDPTLMTRTASGTESASSEYEMTRTTSDGTSMVEELTRTTSSGTQNNLNELKAFLQEHATAWASGTPPAMADKSNGHTLVFKVCSESSAPRDAEFQCFDMYLDYCRGVVENWEGEQRKAALKALQAVFKYLDQHYTNTKERPRAKTTKQATSKLAAGQSLKHCAAMIEQDVNWLPLFYTTNATPDGGPMAEPLDSKVRNADEKPKPASTKSEPVAMSPAMRYKGVSEPHGEYNAEAEARMAEAQAQLEQDPMGFQNYLMSRQAAYDPRISSSVFAANSHRQDRALMGLASSYASSRDPFLHTAGPLREPRSTPAWTGPDFAASAGARYAPMSGLPPATHARYHVRHGPYTHY